MTWFVFCYWYEPDAPKDPVGLVRIWSMARHLGQLGDHVIVFPPRYASSSGHRGFTTIAIPLIPWPFLRPISYVLGSFLAGLWVARKRRPSTVYYRWMASPHPLLFGRLFRSSCICEVNGEPAPNWKNGKGEIKKRIQDWIARQTLRRCDRLVVLTEGLRDLVIQRYGALPHHVIVLPSGTDTDLFTARDRLVCRQRTALDPEAEYIGFVGTFFQYQGLDCLLEAFALVRKRRPSASLLLVGDGEADQPLRDQAERLGLTQAITRTGRVPYAQVPDLIGAMNVCVAPFCAQRGETSPVKLFDYLACGRPAIASAIPSVSAIFSEKQGVVLVPPDDPVSLAASLLRALENPEWAAELGRRGRQFVEQRYDWARLASSLKARLHNEPPPSVHANSGLL